MDFKAIFLGMTMFISIITSLIIIFMEIFYHFKYIFILQEQVELMNEKEPQSQINPY
jgi:hypothetical protein